MESIVVSSRVRLARNLKDYCFPTKLTKEESTKVKEKISSSILSSNSYISKDFRLLDTNKMKEYEKLSLVEKHLISKEGLDSEKFCALVNSEEDISIMVNEEDHIRLQVINKGLELKKSYDLANKIDDLMEENLDYAFDKKLGYLTSCLSNLGCGMRASVMMHLPILDKTNSIKSISNKLYNMGITIRGFYGEGSEGIGNMFQVSNRFSLGISEEDILEMLNKAINYIFEEELKARENISEMDKQKMKDKVFRSFGILRYGKMISSLEAFELLSNIRYGEETKILQTIGLEKIQDTLEIIQSGNMQRINSKNMTSIERDLERAKMLNKIFS